LRINDPFLDTPFFLRNGNYPWVSTSKARGKSEIWRLPAGECDSAQHCLGGSKNGSD